MTDLKLYHENTLIGTITNVAPEDMFQRSGDIELTTAFESYKHVFEYLLANDGLTDGSPQPFDDSYYHNWFLEDIDGKRIEIFIPAIENGEVIWRDP